MFPSKEFQEKAAEFVLVKIDVDKQPDVATKYEVTGIPDILFLAPDGTIKHRVLGFLPKAGLVSEMEKAQTL